MVRRFRDGRMGGRMGATLYSDSHACYLGMPPKLRSKIRGAEACHDYQNFVNREKRLRVPEEMQTRVLWECDRAVALEMLWLGYTRKQLIKVWSAIPPLRSDAAVKALRRNVRHR